MLEKFKLLQVKNLKVVFGGDESSSGGDIIIIDKDKIKVPQNGNPT